MRIWMMGGQSGFIDSMIDIVASMRDIDLLGVIYHENYYDNTAKMPMVTNRTCQVLDRRPHNNPVPGRNY